MTAATSQDDPSGSRGRYLVEPDSEETVEIVAETVEQYLELLRTALKFSGRTAGKVATYVGLPRSTAYHFASTTNHRLPKDRRQIEQFLLGCKLDPHQIRRMVLLWETLNTEKTATVLDDKVASPGGELIHLRPTAVVSTPRQLQAAERDLEDLFDKVDVEDLRQRERAGDPNVEQLITVLQALVGQGGDVVVHGDMHINVGAAQADDAQGRRQSRGSEDSEKHSASARGLRSVKDGGDASPGWWSSSYHTRFRYAVLLLVLVAVIVFGLLAVLLPDRSTQIMYVIGVVGAIGLAMTQLAFRRN